MTEETKNTEDSMFLSDPAPVEQNELETLKAKAKVLGISYHPSIGLAALKAKIEASLESQEEKEEDEDKNPIPESTSDDVDLPDTVVAIKNDYDDSVTYAPKETPLQKRIRLRKECQRLVRVKLTCMNPNKREWPGEIIEVSNSAVGKIKKFIPFNTGDEGYHIPKMLLDFLMTRECTTYRQGAKGLNGVQKRELVLIREFNIEILPDLTEKELKDLAQRQAMANGTQE